MIHSLQKNITVQARRSSLLPGLALAVPIYLLYLFLETCFTIHKRITELLSKQFFIYYLLVITTQYTKSSFSLMNKYLWQSLCVTFYKIELILSLISPKKGLSSTTMIIIIGHEKFHWQACLIYISISCRRGTKVTHLCHITTFLNPFFASLNSFA